MDKIKIADRISTITNPPIICIPLFLIISVVLSFENGTFSISKFIVLELISLVFASVLPMAIILYWAKKLGTDKDISNREDRSVPLIVGVVSYLIGFCVSLALKVDLFMTVLLMCYAINTFIVMIITRKWKISIHTTGLSGPVAALILLLGPIGALFAILYPILIWSRVTLKKHTMAQAIAGGVYGFFMTVFEMMLFIDVFSLPIYNIYPLINVSLYMIAILLTPVILGILSYANIENKGVVFYLIQAIVLFIFIFIVPVDAFIIYIIITITSVLVTRFAGEDFIWSEII